MNPRTSSVVDAASPRMCPGPPPPVAVPSRVHPNAAQPHCAHPYALCPAFAPQCGMRPAPTAEPGQGCGAGSCPERSSEPDQPVPPPSPNVSGQADAGGERGRVGWRPWERGAPWHTAVPPLSPQSSARRMRARCRMLRCWRRVRAVGTGDAFRPSPPQRSVCPAEEAQPMGAGTPQRLPSPCPWPRLASEEQSEGLGCPSAPPGPWRETSLDGPYGKAKNISAEPGDGETRGPRCCPTSPPAVAAVPVSPERRAGDVAPYRFIPVRSVVLCLQMGSSAPSTPEPAIRRGQCQSLRYGVP